MMVRYRSLWKLHNDQDMKKKDSCKIANISTASITKTEKGYVATEMLDKMCIMLDRNVENVRNIMEITSNEQSLQLQAN